MELQPPAGALLLLSQSRLPMLVKSPLLLLARVILHINYYLLANEDSEATGAAGSPERQARFEIRDQATGLFQSFRVYISGSGLCCALAALLLPRWLAAGCLGLAPCQDLEKQRSDIQISGDVGENERGKIARVLQNYN